MTEGVIFCLDNQELDDAARVMEAKKVRRLPVINDKKRMIGMLSLGDVYHTAPRAAKSCTTSQGITRKESCYERVVVSDGGRAQP
jgi:CBS-domain-containing membrane protein